MYDGIEEALNAVKEAIRPKDSSGQTAAAGINYGDEITAPLESDRTSIASKTTSMNPDPSSLAPDPTQETQDHFSSTTPELSQISSTLSSTATTLQFLQDPELLSHPNSEENRGGITIPHKPIKQESSSPLPQCTAPVDNQLRLNPDLSTTVERVKFVLKKAAVKAGFSNRFNFGIQEQLTSAPLISSDVHSKADIPKRGDQNTEDDMTYENAVPSSIQRQPSDTPEITKQVGDSTQKKETFSAERHNPEGVFHMDDIDPPPRPYSP